MAGKAWLVLEDGAVYEGRAFGAETTAFGEVVFNTSMTGYQEMLTDPSYAGQIVMPTYPLIGNYGINAEDSESKRIQVRGFIVREPCDLPSHWQSQRTVHDFLASQAVPGIADIDTRAITRRLRAHGVMMGAITSTASPGGVSELLKCQPKYGEQDFVRQVSTRQDYRWNAPAKARPLKVAVVDMGVKHNILRILRARGCAVQVCPAEATAGEVLAVKPDGVVLSPGPGDPARLDYLTSMVRGILGRVPVFGICLGHQVVAHALGGRTYKLKFGHRGGNHPVRHLETGAVRITAQNHGYAVDADSLPPELVVSHINLNDGTVEGLRHRSLPVLTIQYHAEASPGPLDNVELFDRFLAIVKEHRRERRKGAQAEETGRRL